MKYDPIKSSLGKVFNRTPGMRRLFYHLLDLLLLRTWHVKRAIHSWAGPAPDNATILDAGSGFGQYSYFLSAKNKSWQITAVDVKEDQIEDCNNFFSKIKRSNVNFKYADLTQYSEENTYDLVLSVDVMEHIEDDVAVFKNFYKSLKPGGMALISTPSDQGGSDVHHHDDEYENNGSQSFIDEHVRDGYNIDEIQDKLKSAGFNEIKARYQYGKPGKISWRLSMKYPILMLNASKLFFIILPVYYILTFPVCMILNCIDTRRKYKTGSGLIVKAWKS